MKLKTFAFSDDSTKTVKAAAFTSIISIHWFIDAHTCVLHPYVLQLRHLLFSTNCHRIIWDSIQLHTKHLNSNLAQTRMPRNPAKSVQDNRMKEHGTQAKRQVGILWNLAAKLQAHWTSVNQKTAAGLWWPAALISSGPARPMIATWILFESL